MKNSYVDGTCKRSLKADLHQVSASTLRQLWDDAGDSVLIESNGVAPEWGCNPFSSDSIVTVRNSSYRKVMFSQRVSAPGSWQGGLPLGPGWCTPT